MPQDQDDALPGSGPDTPHVSWREIRDDFHVSLTKTCRDRIRWLRGKATVHPILFWLVEPHRALALDGHLHLPRVQAVLEGSDTALKQQIVGAGFRGKFLNKSEIVVPEPVLAFVNGNTSHPGVWIWATRNRVELWGDVYQRAWLGANKIRKRLPRHSST